MLVGHDQHVGHFLFSVAIDNFLGHLGQVALLHQLGYSVPLEKSLNGTHAVAKRFGRFAIILKIGHEQEQSVPGDLVDVMFFGDGGEKLQQPFGALCGFIAPASVDLR